MTIARTRWVMATALGALAMASRMLAQAPDDVVGRAMHDELTRSMEQLHLDQLERPYFISYAVHERQSFTVSASAGSLVTLDSARARLLSVEVRVGDYKFDNMNFFSMPSFGLGTDVEEIQQGLQLPLEDNYLELRRQMWLATDAGYKRAAAALAAKRAALLNESRPDSLPDFTREPANHVIDERPVPQFPVADLESLVREASRASARPGIFMSSATVSVEIPHTRYLNSEGSLYSRVSPTVMVTATASTQADDGMPLAATIRFRAPSLDGLPRRAQMLAQIGEMCVRLDSLRRAPMQERYNGPVLFQGRAAAEIFSEAFAPALVGRRRIMAASSGMEGGFDRMSEMLGGASFSDKLGGRVLPEFLSVTDDPSAGSLIAYKVDEEGVPSRVTSLVESGILKTLLITRTPVPGVARSTGSRHGGMAVPSNMLVRSEKGASDQALVAQLLSTVQKRGLPYGIIVREVGGGNTASPQQLMASAMGEGSGRGTPDRELRLVYRVYPDGRQEMVRGARATGLDALAFKDIVAAGATPTVYYHAASEIRGAMGFVSSFMSGGGISTEGTPLSSYSVPSLLFDDMTLTRVTQAFPTLPLSAPPEAGN